MPILRDIPSPAVSYAPGRLDLFSLRPDSRVAHKYFEGSWKPGGLSGSGELIGGLPNNGQFVGSLAATTMDRNQFDVFGCGADGLMYYKSFPGDWGLGANINSNWKPFDPLGNQAKFVGSPAAIAMYLGFTDIFGCANDGYMYRKFYRASEWGPNAPEAHWQKIGRLPDTSNFADSTPAIALWGDGFDIFARGTDGQIYHKYLRSAFAYEKWDPNDITGDWETLGAPPASIFVGSPAAVRFHMTRFDLFACGADGQIYHKYYDGNWQPGKTAWESIGYPASGVNFAGSPAVVSIGAGFDIFARSKEGIIYHKYYRIEPWGEHWGPNPDPIDPWEFIGGGENVADPYGYIELGSPSAVFGGFGRFDIFARGVDGRLYNKRFENFNWKPGPNPDAKWCAIGS